MGTLVVDTAPLAFGEPRARWVLLATVLGSGLTFVDGTVVNLALPRMGADLEMRTDALTWVVNGYALTLAAFVLVGGSLADRLGRRRVFTAGVLVFAAASAVCGLAPNAETLIAARALQGVGGAMLTPASLAILQASFTADDRGKAIGAWSGLTGVATAIGPLLGGWLVQVADWRWVFWINLPIAALVLVVARRHVPESSDPAACPRLDLAGAALLIASMGLVTYGLTAFSAPDVERRVAAASVVAGLVLAGLFVWQERRAQVPLLPLSIFRSRVFASTNLVTFLAYAAIGALFFALGITLQVAAGTSPVVAGLALMPVTLVMLAFSHRVGALTVRFGSRPLMTSGAVLAAVGTALLSRVDRDIDLAVDVLTPATVLGVGLTLFVGPLTTTVLAAVPDAQAGLASGVNNAVARTAGLVAVAAIPLIGGLGADGLLDPEAVLAAFRVVVPVCTALFLGAAALAWVGGKPAPEAPARGHAADRHCCLDVPPVAEPAGEVTASR